jgi:hypothetical protein
MPRIKGQRGGGIYGPAYVDPKAFKEGQKSIRAKKAIALVFDWIGGVQAMADWAKENPTDFFTKVWIKTLPAQAKMDVTVTARKSIHEIPDDELQTIVSRECERIAGPPSSEEVTL